MGGESACLLQRLYIHRILADHDPSWVYKRSSEIDSIDSFPSFVYAGQLVKLPVGNPFTEFDVHRQVLLKCSNHLAESTKVYQMKAELNSRLKKLRTLLYDYDNTRHVACKMSSDGDGWTKLIRDTTVRDQLTEIIADDMMIDTCADWVGVLAHLCGIKTTKEERAVDARAELCTRIRESLCQLTVDNKTHELTEMAGKLFKVISDRVEKLDKEFQDKRPNLAHVEPGTMEIFIHCLYTGRLGQATTNSKHPHLTKVHKFKLYDLAAILGAERIMGLIELSFETSISMMTDKQEIMDLLNQLHAVGSTRTEKLRDILMEKLQDLQTGVANPSTPS